MTKLRRSDCAILPLVLKRKWFDMIASGEKREEYRDEKPYWDVRISRWIIRGKENNSHFVIAFSLGYVKPTMFVRAASVVLTNHSVHPEWGEPDTPHWIISLGERVELEDRP